MDDIWATNGGLYLGFENGSPVRFVTDRHMVMLGPNGSGKTRREIYTNMATLIGWSIVCIDYKGEITKNTAEYRMRKGCHSIVLNPFRAGGLGSDGFNPVASLSDQDDLIDDAMNIAAAICPVEGREPHWSESGQDYLAGHVMYSRLTDAGGGSLIDVRNRAFEPAVPLKKTIGAMMRFAEANDWPEIYNKVARFKDINEESRELLGIISHASTKMRFVDSRPLQKDLLGGGHDWSRLKREPTTVSLILPGNRTGTHAAWLKVVLTSIIQSLMASVEDSKVPVLFMLDEAAKLGGLPIIEENMAMMRGYGIKLMSVYQDVPQAKLALKERFYSYMANAGVLLSFGAQDMETARFLSDRSGHYTDYVASTQTGEILPFEKVPHQQVNLSQTKVPILFPQDVIGLPDGDAILFTHKDRHVRKVNLPDPSVLPQMKDVM